MRMVFSLIARSAIINALPVRKPAQIVFNVEGIENYQIACATMVSMTIIKMKIVCIVS
jgi:hypothetical protein